MSLEERISGKSDTRGEHLFDIFQRWGLYGAISFAVKATTTVMGGLYGYYLAASHGLSAGYTALSTIAGGATGKLVGNIIMIPSHIKELYRNAVSLGRAIFGEATPSRGFGAPAYAH